MHFNILRLKFIHVKNSETFVVTDFFFYRTYRGNPSER
jgi:hypothetical protein